MPLPSRRTIKLSLVRLLAENGRMPIGAVHKALAAEFSLTPLEKSELRSDQLLYKNEIRWARQELVDEGVLAKPEEAGRGHWQLRTLKPSSGSTEENSTSGPFFEGAIQTVLLNRYERSHSARTACLNHHGYKCSVCALSLEEHYGAIGVDAIHVHHLVPLATVGRAYVLDPIRDLVPICPNCHHMIHRRSPPFSVAELKTIIKSARTLAAQHPASIE